MKLQWTYLSPKHFEAERMCCITTTLMKWGTIPLKWFLPLRPPSADGVRWYSPEHQLERCGQEKSGDEPTGRCGVQEVLSTSLFSLCLTQCFFRFFPFQQQSLTLCSLPVHLLPPFPKPQLCCFTVSVLAKCRDQWSRMATTRWNQFILIIRWMDSVKLGFF